MPGNECPFCNLPDPVLENELAVVKRDRFPVTEGHLLIIPRRHATDWFDLTRDERIAIDDLLVEAKAWLDDQYQPDGYNIGMNCGEVAGQTVFHMHCHLIPRYRGDSEKPAGGVRGVIPGKQQYR
jgi:diadenosine tetraphosphate (Ap4A) HIT family hydrolase